MSEIAFPLTGGCGCGAVRYEIATPLVAAGYCHCTRCQRRTGTAASAQARVAPGSFTIVRGAEEVRAWAPEGGFEKHFCGRWGWGLFSRDPHDHDVISVRLGSFDGDPGIRPQVRTMVAYAALWEPIPDDGLPRHPESNPG